MIETTMRSTMQAVAPLEPFTELETWYGIFAALAFEETLRRVVKSRAAALAESQHPENQRAEEKGRPKSEVSANANEAEGSKTK
jgi:hypothetical protein